MGMFDNLQFDPSTYGGQQGGLLDMIRAAVAQQQAPSAGFQPSSSDVFTKGAAPDPMIGLASSSAMSPGTLSPNAGAYGSMIPVQPAQPSPLDTAQWPYGPVGAPSTANAQAPAAAPAPQNAPMNIGGYMMPRIGSGFPKVVASDDDEDTPTANPAVASPANPAAVAQPAASPGIGDRLMTGYQNLHHGGGLIGSIVSAVTGQRNDPQGVALQQQAQSQNLTAKALLAKGVDPQVVAAAVQPGNTEMLKTLVDQNFGPAKAPTVLGNGYVWNAKTQKVERAYEPDDKTPQSVLEYKYYRDNLPSDQKPMDYPTFMDSKARTEAANPNGLQVLPRGNEVIKKNPDGTVTVVHKNEDSGGGQMLSPGGVDLAANRILNGEKGVTTGFARSKPDMAAVYNRVAELATERKMDASDILSNINNEFAAASAARSFGGMTAKQETYSNTAAKAIDIAEKASEAVPRTTWVPVNKAILAWKEKSGDPKVAALGQSLETLTQEYARAVGGGHGTVSDKEEAREYLAKAQTHEQLVARFNIMRQEIARGRESVGESAAHVGQVYRNNIRRGSGLPEPGTKDAAQLEMDAGSATPTPGAYVWTPDKGIAPK